MPSGADGRDDEPWQTVIVADGGPAARRPLTKAEDGFDSPRGFAIDYTPKFLGNLRSDRRAA